MALTDKQVQNILQAVSSAEQAAQEAKQIAQGINQDIQSVKQSAQSAQQAATEAKQAVQGSFQEKSSDKTLVGESKQEEINSGEALRLATVSNTRLWNFDEKQIAASEQSERVRSLDYDRALKEIEIKTKEIELARKQHDFANQQKLDSLHLRKAEDTEVFKHAVNMEYAKFNSAVSEPIAPNTKDSGSKVDASAAKK